MKRTLTSAQDEREGIVRRSILPIATAALCAGLIIAARFLPPGSAFVFAGIAFAYTDALILIASGIGGMGCGLLTFSLLFVSEFFLLEGNTTALYSVSTYLVLALAAANLSYAGWFRDAKKTIVSCAALTLLLALCWKITFAMILPEPAGVPFGNEPFPKLLIGALPETAAASLLVHLFFRFAPEKLQKAFDPAANAGKRVRRVLAERVTRFSLLESLLLCLVSIVCTAIARAASENTAFTLAYLASGWKESLRLGLLMMSASVPVAYLFNLSVMWHVVLPINAMSERMDRYFETEENERAGALPALAIHSGDEIENLYHSLQKLVGDMNGYIDRLLEEERKTAHMTKGFMAALAQAVDAKDRYTSGHSARVAAYAVQLARRLNKSEAEQEEIYMMGILHDIGKIGVPEAIINKPGKLDDAEYAKMKEHPQMGYEILRNVEEMPGLAVGAHYHHERWDGRGYPEGLSGEEIPEAARIIAVADTYDAMTSNRSYRGVLPQEQVRAEIERCKGTQFDPRVADAMLAMIDADRDYQMHE